jgi:DNA-binding SARP family transcriptional activator/tetratricopeptide (TPR) repeat protein
MTLRIRLLGPVTAEVDGRPVRVGPRLRRLLAVLSLNIGHPVPHDRLLAALWGEQPPPRAMATLRSHIAHLRRALGGQDLAILVAEDAGYVLRIPADGLDTVAFQRAAEAGRRALARGDASDAADHLRTALAWWRGAALEGVAEEHFAMAEAARLEALRREALRARFEADMALGRHGEIIGELESRLETEGDDERLLRMLIVCLHRSGRNRRAAQVCRVGVEHNQRYGLDVSELQALQRAVLLRSPALDWTPPPAERPFQLPPKIEFVGRADELAILRGRLTAPDAAPISVISGPPGTGKTALAVQVAHELAPHFRDGVLYVNLRGAESQRTAPIAVLAQFLRALGVRDEQYAVDLETATARFRSALAGRRVLVVLDNAADSAQVFPLLPTAPGTAALVTSRGALADLDGATPLPLDVMSEEEGTALLARFVPVRRIDTERDAVARVVRLCGALPLALRIVGARLRASPAWSLATMADRLADERHRLDELAVGELAVRSSFELAYGALPPADRTVLRRIGLLDCPEPTAEPVAALADCRLDVARAALDRLTEAQLLGATAPGRFRLHDLMRLFARERAEAEDDPATRVRALERALGWYAAMAVDADWTLLTIMGGRDSPAEPATGGFADARAALAWLDRERGNLAAAVLQAAAHSGTTVPAIAVKLDAALRRYFMLHQHFSDWETITTAALHAARRVGDVARVAAGLNCLGVIHNEQRRYDQAIRFLTDSRRMLHRIGDLGRESIVLNNMAVTYLGQGRHAEAMDRLHESLDVIARAGAPENNVFTLDTLGNAHADLGRHGEAAECLADGLRVARDVGDRRSECEFLSSLARLERLRGRHAHAVAYYRRSLTLCREIGYRFGEAKALRGLGRAVLATSGPAAAHGAWSQALSIFTELGAAEAEAVRAELNGIGSEQVRSYAANEIRVPS